MKYWTCYWNKKTWDEWQLNTQTSRSASCEIQYVASSKFNSSDQQPGDIVYILTMKNSTIYLGGRLVVSKFTNDKEAVARQLGLKEIEVYSANALKPENYLLGNPEKTERFRSVSVPRAQVDEIHFVRKSGDEGPVKKTRDGKIDPNSLITPLQVASGSELKLNELLNG